MNPFIVNLLVFGRLLRRAGFDVPVGRMLDLVRALETTNLSRRDDVFFTCRSLLVQRPDQLRPFAALFDLFWRAHADRLPADPSAAPDDAGASRAVAAALGELVASPEPGDGAAPSDTIVRTWSDLPGLARKDIATFTPDDLRRAEQALDRLAWLPGLRRTRRWIRGAGPQLDLRRALARALRTGGDVVAIPTRRRRVRPRRLVLLCDVSGSMERYARVLLHFAHGVGQRHRRLEVFLFSTSLTRVTHQLRARRIAQAAAALSATVHDWSGGTRIGAALQQFNRRWSRRVLREGPVVLLISDGWDRGDPQVLKAEVAHLQRSCHRLIWLNPLIGTTGFEPLTRGLQAALPHVDDFLPARTLADLGELALHLESVTERPRAARRVRP